MALLQIVLLLLYALPFMLCLPITSTPLEDNPDNLAWDTQLSYENRYASDRESVRKIPKSIFITPNHPDAHGCRSGYVMGDDGKCYKSQNFNLDPLDILKTQVETFLVHDKMPTTVDYDEDYDYDNYDSTESSGPYYVPIGFGVNEDTPDKKGDIHSMPFLADNSVKKETSATERTATERTATERTATERSATTTESSNSTKYNEWMEPVLPGTPSTIPNFDQWSADIMAISKDITRKIEKLTASTTSPSDTTTDQSTLILNDEIKIDSSMSTKKDHVEKDDSLSTLDDDKKFPSSTENLLSHTPLIEDESSDVASTTLTIGEKDISSTGSTYTTSHSIEDNHIETTEQIDEDKILDKELQSESLFQDNGSMGTSTSISDGTTEINENDVSTEPLNYLSHQEINKFIHTPPLVHNNNKNPIVIVPTVEQVQIVTPGQQSTNHRASSISQRSSVPSSTSTYNSELQTAELLNIDDSISNKKLRESVIKHELNEDAMETIDTNNRFVYTHLGISSNDPGSSTSSTTNQPVTQRNLLEQLKFINKFTEESRKNNRIRFPESSSVNIFSNFKGGTIKFPGPVQQRTSEPIFNRLIPDHILKKPSEPTPKPLFSWMPAGTTFDFGRNSRPIFSRFWNKMPLIRDPAISSNESSDQPRSNSKSPTDNLYKDVPTSEVYKVISSKNYKHDNR